MRGHFNICLFVIVLIALSGISYGDDAVCPHPNDCVYEGYCFAPGPAEKDTTGSYLIYCNGVIGDIDCDGDRDYCVGQADGGVWQDCGSGCSSGDCCPNVYYCENNDCKPSMQMWMEDSECADAGGEWTSGITGSDWRNYDDPGGSGDFETYNLSDSSKEVIGIQCERASDETPFYLLNNIIHAGTTESYGCTCVNDENKGPYDSCPDLKARWCVRSLDLTTCTGYPNVKSGEENVFGGYISYNEVGCCGDDEGEYYDPKRCEETPEDEHRCCDKATDIVTPDGLCLPCSNIFECFASNLSCKSCYNEQCNGVEGDTDETGTACSDCSGMYGLDIGDSSSECWNGLCCGDDANEYPRNCRLNLGGSPALDCKGGTVYACCDGKNDCLNPLDNSCVEGSSPRTPAKVKDSGEDMYALCSYGTWMDCDSHGAVNDPGILLDCGDSICGSNGGVPIGKGENLGDYSQWSKPTCQCCGDDEGEYFVSVLRNGDPVSSLGVRNECGSIVHGVCCPPDTTYVVYGGNDASNFTCIACVGKGKPCTTDYDCCVEDPETHKPLYCSKTMPNSSSTDPHCCPEGYYWDDKRGVCRNYASCYQIGNPNSCQGVYDTSSWWNDIYCIPTTDGDKACCPADIIGNPFGDASQGAYHYWPIESY